MKYYEIKQGEYPKELPKNSNTQFFGNGWSVKIRTNKYYLECLSSSLQGGVKEIEITEAEYMLARNSQMDLNDFILKYNL
jgi:hypothetical protein